MNILFTTQHGNFLSVIMHVYHSLKNLDIALDHPYRYNLQCILHMQGYRGSGAVLLQSDGRGKAGHQPGGTAPGGSKKERTVPVHSSSLKMPSATACDSTEARDS